MALLPGNSNRASTYAHIEPRIITITSAEPTTSTVLTKYLPMPAVVHALT